MRNSPVIRSHKDLRVWQEAMDLAMEVFTISKSFPADERYSLTDQLRRSSRSVPANLSEAWRKRRYEAAFVSKLNDAEGEAGETQTHLEIARRCGYVTPAQTGQKGVYTRKRGLDRDANKALLMRHISENAATGAKLDELLQVLPALSRHQVQTLVRELKRAGLLINQSATNAARWFPSVKPQSDTTKTQSRRNPSDL
jgi:four helix bundle protein